MSTILAFAVPFHLNKIDDELQIATEIRRKSIFLGFSNIAIVGLWFAGYDEWQSLTQTVQQMFLSLSMATILLFPHLTLRLWHRVSPATAFLLIPFCSPSIWIAFTILNIGGNRREDTLHQALEGRDDYVHRKLYPWFGRRTMLVGKVRFVNRGLRQSRTWSIWCPPQISLMRNVPKTIGNIMIYYDRPDSPLLSKYQCR